jgi:hypothetical protein
VLLQQAYVGDRVRRWKRVLEWQRARKGKHVIDPYSEAKERVASDYDVTPDQLDRWLYPRRDDPYREFRAKAAADVRDNRRFLRANLKRLHPRCRRTRK